MIDTIEATQIIPRTVCECESADCLACTTHNGHECSLGNNLSVYVVASFRQTLCANCAQNAARYCSDNRYDFERIA